MVIKLAVGKYGDRNWGGHTAGVSFDYWDMVILRYGPVVAQMKVLERYLIERPAVRILYQNLGGNSTHLLNQSSC